MSAKVKENASVLRLLAKAKPATVKAMLKDADGTVVDSLCECCLNVLAGRVKLSPSEKKKLSRHKNALRALIKRGASMRKKKALLQKGGFLGALLKPILGLLLN